MIDKKKVLVLNKSWIPVSVLSLDKALIKLFSEYSDGVPKAVIVDCANDFNTMTWSEWSKITPSDGEERLRSVSAAFRIPLVIQLTKYDKTPIYKSKYCRRTVYRRDGNQCQYCGEKPGISKLTIDHVVPRSQGGMTTWANCVLACIGCNTRKGGMTPAQAKMNLLRQPKVPKMNSLKCDVKVDGWEPFLGASYWIVELGCDED